MILFGTGSLLNSSDARSARSSIAQQALYGIQDDLSENVPTEMTESKLIKQTIVDTEVDGSSSYNKVSFLYVGGRKKADTWSFPYLVTKNAHGNPQFCSTERVVYARLLLEVMSFLLHRFHRQLKLEEYILPVEMMAGEYLSVQKQAKATYKKSSHQDQPILLVARH